MTISISTSQAAVISGISVPDSKLANEITEFIRDTESTLVFNHSSRVYYFGALAGQRRGLKFDAELLYAGPMFHDVGLVPAYSSAADRFEVDGANAAAIAAARHLLQLFRRQLQDDKSRRKLRRLSQRLLNLRHEIDCFAEK